MNAKKAILGTIGSLMAALLVTLLLAGCTNIFGQDEEPAGGGSADAVSRAATDNLANDLEDNTSLTPAQITAITEGAVGSLSEGGLTDSSGAEEVLTTMVGGGQRALASSGFSDADRLAAIEAIAGSAVGSLADPAVSRGIRASQASDVIGAIVAASVSAIDDAGFDGDVSRRQAAGSSTGGAVRNLGRAGITSDTALQTVRGIAQSGVIALRDGGYEAADIGETARTLTRRTLGTLDDAGISGLDLEFELRTFGREVSKSVTGNLGRSGIVTSGNAGAALTGVSRGATGSLRDLEVRGDFATIVNDLTSEVSRAVSESLADLRGDIPDLDIQASVRTVVRGTTEGLGDLGEDVRFGSTVITAETFNTVIRGASTGARRADDTISAEDLVTALSAEITVLSEELTALRTQLEALQTQVATMVDEGVAAADNEEPTAEITVTNGSGQLSSGGTIDAGTAVTITGTGTDTAEDDEADRGSMDVRISLQGPDGRELDSDRSTELTGANSLAVSLATTPNVSGTYRVTLTVSDGIESASASFSFEVVSNVTVADKDALMARGVSYLEEGYVNDALNDFQTLYEADSNYVPGALAYSLLDMATILTDEEVVSFARDTLGLTDYPTRVADILNFEYWMRSVYDPSSDSFVLFPRVANQTDRDGDGVVDPGERLVQIAENMIAASATNSDLTDLLAGRLGEKLDALQTRVGGISASGGFEITWEMVFQSDAEAIEAGWPTSDELGQVQSSFTIGTAELNMILATGRFIQFLNQWGQAIDLSVNYDYYLFDESDEFRLILNPPDSETGLTPSDIYDFPALGPLAEGNFLKSRADAETHLAAAGTAFVTMLETIAGAVEDISSRGEDSQFTVNAGMVEELLSFASDATLTDPAAFLDNVATVFRSLADDVSASVDAGGGTPAYIPVPGEAENGAEPEEYFATFAANWPTTTGGVITEGILAFDFGTLFGTSIGGIAGVFELTSATREPVLYKYSNPGSVVRLSEEDGATVTELETAAKTASFSNTPMTAAAFNGEVNDATNIYFARIPDATLGMAPGSLTQADLDQFNIDANVWWDEYYDSELMSYVEYEYFEGHEVFARFDPDDSDKVEMFIRVPAQAVGHLFVEQGTEFTVYDWALDPDEYTRTFTSLGSFWWGVLTDIDVSSSSEDGDGSDGPTYEGPIYEEPITQIPEDATLIATGSLVELTAIAGQVLWYRVNVTSGQTYTIALDDYDDGPLYNTDVYFQGYDSEGTQLFDRDGGSATVTAPADGVIYITIDGAYWNESGPVGITVTAGGI